MTKTIISLVLIILISLAGISYYQNKKNDEKRNILNKDISINNNELSALDLKSIDINKNIQTIKAYIDEQNTSIADKEKTVKTINDQINIFRNEIYQSVSAQEKEHKINMQQFYENKNEQITKLNADSINGMIGKLKNDIELLLVQKSTKERELQGNRLSYIDSTSSQRSILERHISRIIEDFKEKERIFQRNKEETITTFNSSGLRQIKKKWDINDIENNKKILEEHRARSKREFKLANDQLQKIIASEKQQKTSINNIIANLDNQITNAKNKIAELETQKSTMIIKHIDKVNSLKFDDKTSPYSKEFLTALSNNPEMIEAKKNEERLLDEIKSCKVAIRIAQENKIKLEHELELINSQKEVITRKIEQLQLQLELTKKI